jgi:hypothetical protein
MYWPIWYRCEITDGYVDDKLEPDWSRVPIHKRERVRENWRKSQEPKPEIWNLWGPQIPFYESQPKYKVRVLGPLAP